MEFASLYEISNALRNGLVDGHDELLTPGQTTWVRVADHSALKAHVRPASGIRPGSAAVLVAVWLSTRLALRSTRVRKDNRVDSRRR
jgi:hypothetical protein